MKEVLHHIHKRKRAAQRHVHNKNIVRILDSVALTNGILGSLTPIPQIYTILSTKEATGVSVLTWELFAASSIIWLVYGLYHKDAPIIYSSGISIFMYLGVIGAALYVS